MSPVLKRGSQGEDVRALQAALKQLGFLTSEPDGVFGLDTYQAVERLQRDRGISPDGIVGELTWAEIKTETHTEPPALVLPPWILDGFKGDSAWIHEMEGHSGKPYWPEGSSGITIDPGIDLGYIDNKDLAQIFGNVYCKYLTQDEIDTLQQCCGIKGYKANAYLRGSQGKDLRRISISRAEANEVFPYALDPFWDAVRKRFHPYLEEAPGYIHTVLASLAYNRGPGNPDLGVLRKPLQDKDYRKVGNLVASMQQGHSQQGIRFRRRKEGKYILKHLGVLV